MKKFEVSIEDYDTGYDSRYKLIVKHEGNVIIEETDGGEPEDNSFTRSYSWIKSALEKVYALGQEDKVKEITENEIKKIEAECYPLWHHELRK